MKHSSLQSTTHTITTTAMMSAVICVCSPLSITVGPIPLSLTNFIIFLSIYLLGTRLSIISLLAYFLIGIMGFPVFSGFMSGIGIFLGPTGGYLIGFIPMIEIAGWFITHFTRYSWHVFGCILGCVSCYALGTVGYCLYSSVNIFRALPICVFPFILTDFLKILLAPFVGVILQKRLSKLRIS